MMINFEIGMLQDYETLELTIGYTNRIKEKSITYIAYGFTTPTRGSARTSRLRRTRVLRGVLEFGYNRFPREEEKARGIREVKIIKARYI